MKINSKLQISNLISLICVLIIEIIAVRDIAGGIFDMGAFYLWIIPALLTGILYTLSSIRITINYQTELMEHQKNLFELAMKVNKTRGKK